MFIVELLGWWYGRGWLWSLQQINTRLQRIGRVFAVRMLLKTLFSPWKQITSPSSFHNFFQAAADNAVSRIIGFIVRSTMLFIALLWSIITIVSGVVFVLIWPLIPLSVILLPALALSGVTL